MNPGVKDDATPTRFVQPWEARGFKMLLNEKSMERSQDWQVRERRPVPLPPPVPTVRECLQAFVRWLRDDTPPPVSLTDGSKALAVVDACQRSALSGTPVLVGSQ